MSTLLVAGTATENIHPPKHPGDVGYDLACKHDVMIRANGFYDLHTGVRVGFPVGIWGMIVARSSTWRRLGLEVIMGIIDTGYHGELLIGVRNPGAAAVFVTKGTRLAQLIPMVAAGPWMNGKPFSLVNVTEEELEAHTTSSRGTDGFGSTGGA